MLSRLVLLPLGAAVLVAETPEFFETRVRPLLAKNCFNCHTTSKLGGLEMVSREALLKGGATGPAIVPGDPENSLLIQAVRQTHPRIKMPPAERLTAAEIGVLETWIKGGAVWPEHRAEKIAAGSSYAITPEQRDWWAFQPVRKPPPPAVKDRAWPRTPIDHFILARLEDRGLKPAPPADKRRLLRRVYYDLTGLPPTPEEVDAFLADMSPEAFAKVAERLLASPRYGERWGRHWLDVARYSDDKLNSTQDEPYPNAWRYRDWVIQAFNDDMPYDLFIKAQIAGDLLDRADREKLVAGLGFFALSPQFQDDRVDVTTRGFLALTAQCAQCHDHKFDPIPTKDYYSLLGVFSSTSISEFPLAPEEEVKEYKGRAERVEQQEKELNEFLDKQANQLAEILAAQTARYLAAARGALAGREPQTAELDRETLDRWIAYLKMDKEHPFLSDWQRETFSPDEFQDRVLALIKEKKRIDDTNFIRLGGSQQRGDLARADLLSLERDPYFLWRDLFSKDRFGKFDSGILYYKGDKIGRFLEGQWKRHLEELRAELERRKKEVPEQYPFYHVIKDAEKPRNLRVRIRGSAENLGEEAPRGFLSILCEGEPKPFENGSGRLELANAIASPSNPLTARVMVNRIWMHHFGSGIVGTPSNFGRLGERPSHPELLDYLAARFVELGWSMKALHREIVLSRVYALSSGHIAENYSVDPENRLSWRANRRRLEIEPMRDTLLSVSGELDLSAGGPPLKLTDEKNLRRTVYGFVSRRRLDGTLSLFDFPNPNNTSEQRIETATPLQQLFFLNSDFIASRAAALARRVETAGPGDTERIRTAYRILYGRWPTAAEVKLGLEYLKSESGGWQRYAQALLASNELLFVN